MARLTLSSLCSPGKPWLCDLPDSTSQAAGWLGFCGSFLKEVFQPQKENKFRFERQREITSALGDQHPTQAYQLYPGYG